MCEIKCLMGLFFSLFAGQLFGFSLHLKLRFSFRSVKRYNILSCLIKKIANVYQICQMCCGVIPNPDVYNFTKAAVDLELFKIDRRITCLLYTSDAADE